MHGTTLVFDLDGTLVDTAPDLVAATNHALADKELAALPGALLRPWISFGARRMIVEGLKASSHPLSDAEVDRLLARFLDYYESNIARESRPFPGAIEAIKLFKTKGARIAICTNKRAALSETLLSELQIRDLFDGLAGRDTFPVSKPHPDHLLGAIGLAGGDKSRSVMIGDSNVDIATARAAGIPVVGCTFGYSEEPVANYAPDAVISHYRELQGALQRLLAAPA